MAGPWFVDPENGSLTNNGLSVDTPWQLIPGQTGATAQTGYGVVAGDTINVKNGTTCALRIVVPANNLTYRGYGIADNVLVLNLPRRNDLTRTYQKRVVREAEVHEGMWTIDATTIDSAGAALETSIRTGCVFEDINIIGPQVGSRAAVTFAGSGNNVSGITIRRFAISGSTANGISVNTKNATIEYGRIEYTKGDNITLVGSTANASRAGSTDTLRYLELREPNRQISGGTEVGTDGDWIQCLPANGLWDGTLIVHDITGYKSTDAKQGLVLHQTAAAATVTVRNLHISGGGDCQILTGHIKNRMTIENVYATDWNVEGIPLFRFGSMDTSPPAYAMDTGSTLTIRNVISDSDGFGLYSSVVTAAACDFNGTIEISGITATGANTGALSYASSFAFWSETSQATYGLNFQLRLANNNVQMTGKPHVILPPGAEDDSRFSITNNAFSDSTYAAGTEVYADLAAFEAAHSGATGNLDGDPLLSSSLRPMQGSPLIGAGTHLGYTTDLAGHQRWNPPTIGALEGPIQRTTALTRTLRQ